MWMVFWCISHPEGALATEGSHVDRREIHHLAVLGSGWHLGLFSMDGALVTEGSRDRTIPNERSFTSLHSVQDDTSGVSLNVEVHWKKILVRYGGPRLLQDDI